MLKLEVRRRIKKSLWVLLGATLASFLTMVLIQLLFKESMNYWLYLRKALMLGFSMAIIVILLPGGRVERYPWQ